MQLACRAAAGCFVTGVLQAQTLGLTLANMVETLTLTAHQRHAKGKEMELLFITLAFSAVALVAQFGDFMSRRAAANAIGV